jgi:hypothetical protein
MNVCQCGGSKPIPHDPEEDKNALCHTRLTSADSASVHLTNNNFLVATKLPAWILYRYIPLGIALASNWTS